MRRPVSLLPPLSIRQRLLLALCFLGIATALVGAMAWVALDRANGRLEALHRETLAEVGRALTLSKQAADLATSAPFLLTQSSPFRIRREGEAILARIDALSQGAQAEPGSGGFGAALAAPVADLRAATTGLIEASDAIASYTDRVLRRNTDLSRLERRYATEVAQGASTLSQRRDWLTLQRTASALLGAGRSGNLIGVGEFNREYVALRAMLLDSGISAAQTEEIARLDRLANGPDGLFELRRNELAETVRAQNLLVGIRLGADGISDVAAAVVAATEARLSAERNDTTSTIGAAKTLIVLAGIASAAVAVGAAWFVAGYVTGNLRAISDAMLRLAAGDRGKLLPRALRDLGTGDEIGKLMRSFRVFRANALRLDRSNRQLHRQNALLEGVFRNISDGVAIVSETGHLAAANPSLGVALRLPASALQGRPDMARLLELSPFRPVAAPSSGLHSELYTGEGHAIEVRSSALPGGGAVWLFTDVTERRRIDERLQQIRRIESLGKVTGEVAHDFGNILSTISGSLHLLETAPEPAARLLRNRIAGAVDIGSALTQRLLAFARKQHLEPEVVGMNTLIEGVADLVAVALRDDVVLDIRPAPSEVFVRVDPGQMESAILNLCLNAGQAITGPGRITLTVQSAADHVAVEVADTGCGMDADVLRHAMEPFFSARADGNGTGLGLSMVYGFIRQSGGDVQMASTPGQGTTVRLTLPVHRAEAEADPPAPRGIALVVEDDPRTLAASVALMQDLGFVAEPCATHAEAAARLEQGPVAVLFTDLHLEDGQTGWTLAQSCLDRWPQARVVVASGRLPTVTPPVGQDARIACLPKPVEAAALALALSEAQGPGTAAVRNPDARRSARSAG